MHRRVPIPGRSFLHIACASVVIIQENLVNRGLHAVSKKSQFSVLPVLKARGYTGDIDLHGGLVYILRIALSKKLSGVENEFVSSTPMCVQGKVLFYQLLCLKGALTHQMYVYSKKTAKSEKPTSSPWVPQALLCQCFVLLLEAPNKPTNKQ